MGDNEQRRHGLVQLQQRRAHFQDQLAHAVILKFIPHIRFIVDDSVVRGNRVLEILDDLENPSSAS
jgi:ribosome-binding factor A